MMFVLLLTLTNDVCLTAVATVTAVPNGHMLGYGSDSGSGPVGMRPVYPRTQYNMQYSGQGPPRVHAGDIPHAAQSKYTPDHCCLLLCLKINQSGGAPQVLY